MPTALPVSAAVGSFMQSSDQATMQSALGLGTPTTIGVNILNLTNPGAIAFLRLNADNTPSALSATDMRTALGLETMATQAASAVAITGGSVSGLTSFGLGSISPLFVVGDANTFYTGSGWGVGFRSTVDTVARLWVMTGIGMSATAPNAPDVFLQPQSANVLQLGVAGSSPSAQCFKGPNGSGTNIVGGKLSIAAGQSTGSATPAILALQSTAAGSSGTTAQTLVDVMLVRNSQLIEFASGVIIDGTGSGFRLGSTGASLLGFWGVAPVSQFNASSGAGISSAGSGTSVNDDSTFAGASGATTYTVNDIVEMLKRCGIAAR